MYDFIYNVNIFFHPNTKEEVAVICSSSSLIGYSQNALTFFLIVLYSLCVMIFVCIQHLIIVWFLWFYFIMIVLVNRCILLILWLKRDFTVTRCIHDFVKKYVHYWHYCVMISVCIQHWIIVQFIWFYLIMIVL